MPKNPSRAQPSSSEEERLQRLVELETGLRKRGFRYIAGVDEAGRGPLAGPVVAAACMIPEGVFFPGINDSKLLTPQKRERLYQALLSHPHVVHAVGVIGVEQIDKLNILQATLLAMREAVAKLQPVPDYLLIDGAQCCGGGVAQEAVIQGDQRSQSIAAASNIAKRVRDLLMLELHELYPQYGFDRHKGYGTAEHLRALREHGPSPIHRRSFAPVGEMIALSNMASS